MESNAIVITRISGPVFSTGLWVDGDMKFGRRKYHFQVKVDDETSVYRIANSRISKLAIWETALLVASYDRGWMIEPDKPSRKKVLDKILACFYKN